LKIERLVYHSRNPGWRPACTYQDHHSFGYSVCGRAGRSAPMTISSILRRGRQTSGLHPVPMTDGAYLRLRCS